MKYFNITMASTGTRAGAGKEAKERINIRAQQNIWLEIQGKLTAFSWNGTPGQLFETIDGLQKQVWEDQNMLNLS